jgi:hypothetical protein
VLDFPQGKANRLNQSMNRREKSIDNPDAESFFGKLRRKKPTRGFAKEGLK